VPSETSGEPHATPSETPSIANILEQRSKTLAPKPASRVFPGLRWAAAVALIVTLMALAAAGTGFGRDAELQLAAPHQAGLRESAGRPASIVEEMWRLRARSAF
jgi:hypothetical protein